MLQLIKVVDTAQTYVQTNVQINAAKIIFVLFVVIRHLKYNAVYDF